MADTYRTNKAIHVVLAKNITHQAITLAQQEASLVPSHHPGGVLSAMLKDRQGVIQRLVHRLIGH